MDAASERLPRILDQSKDRGDSRGPRSGNMRLCRKPQPAWHLASNGLLARTPPAPPANGDGATQ